MSPPARLRVVDFTRSLAGAFCSKMLADGGVHVTMVEPADGHPLRARRISDGPPGTADSPGALFRFLAAGKESVIGDGVPVGAFCSAEETAQLIAQLDDFVAAADIVLVDHIAAGTLRERHPSLVIVAITPFGTEGPYAGRPTTEFIVQAESGGIACRGRPEQPPVQAGGEICEWTTGCYAAPAVLIAARHARATGVGAFIDVSMVECMAIAMSVFMDLSHSMGGSLPLSGRPARSVETPSIERAKDGWIGFNTNTGEMFQNFLLLIERPDLLDDADLATFQGRQGRIDEFKEVIAAWTTQHTVADILERAAELRIPCAQVHTAETMLDDEHLSARGVFVPDATGTFVQPRRPYAIGGDFGSVRPPPAVGEHQHPPTIDRSVRTATVPPAPSSALPLEGLRVVDLTSWWAGPSSTHVLACLGADVLHVESTSHADGMRMTGYAYGTPDWWEWGHMFVAANTNKRGVTLDMKFDEGLTALKSLIAKADVVVENFAPRVAEKFGLDFEGMAVLNPTAVFARMPAFGLTGPWRDRVGFAQTMEQMSGMAWVTGRIEDEPLIIRGPCDPIAGMHGATAILFGLLERDRTGTGVAIEAAMVEAAVNCSAEQIVEFSAYGEVLDRTGNRSRNRAPQNIYPSSEGGESYVAISVATDAQWNAMLEVLDRAAIGGCGSGASRPERRAAADAIDEELGDWVAQRTPADVVETLVAAGVPAGEVVDSRVLNQHEQLIHRRFYEVVDHPAVGSHPMPGMPYRWSGVSSWLRRPSPLLGEHTTEVLGEWLGMGVDEVDAGADRGLGGDRPAGL